MLRCESEIAFSEMRTGWKVQVRWSTTSQITSKFGVTKRRYKLSEKPDESISFRLLIVNYKSDSFYRNVSGCRDQWPFLEACEL